MSEFAEKRILITGGSRGIGLGLARFFKKERARVFLCARKEAGLLRAREELGDVTTVPAHLGKPEDVENLFAAVEKAWGGLDILVNNVGMNIFTPATVEAEVSLWDKIMESNLRATFLCCRRAFPLLKRQGGVMVNISSLAGLRAAPGMGIYGIAKAGINMLTQVLARELAAYGIRVNAVAPGMVETDFSKPFWGQEEILKEILRNIPLGRIARIEDVVNLVAFLASERAAYLTGEVITLSGGSEA